EPPRRAVREASALGRQLGDAHAHVDQALRNRVHEVEADDGDLVQGLCAGRGSTGFPRRSRVKSCTSAIARSCARRGSFRTQWATYWIGSPRSVNGTTFAPDRTATV